MITLKNLLTEGRSEPITEDEALRIYSERAKNFDVLTDQPIYRGNKHLSASYATIDPSEFENRKSEHADRNYYTLIINNAKNWSRYPKREIICTTNVNKAASYGNVFFVVPYDGVDWGVCPRDDIWESFPNVFEKFDRYANANIFINILRNVMEDRAGLKHYEDIDTFSELKGVLKNLGRDLKNLHNYSDITKSGTQNMYDDFWEAWMNSSYYRNGDFHKFIFDLMDPNKNGFEYQSRWKGVEEDREVWTDGKCLLIKEDALKESFSDKI